MKVLKSILIIVSLLIISVATATSLQVTDGSGHTVTLKQPAKRIISLAPNLTEILFAIGAGNDVVGTSSYSDYPAAAKKIPVVDSNSEINL